MNDIIRTNLYRGKHVDGEGWVFGCLITYVFYKVGDPESIPYILSTADIDYDSWDDFSEGYGIYEVDPATIGKATGYKGFFTGDIVMTGSDKAIGVICFGEYRSPAENTHTCHIGFYIDWQGDQKDLLRKDFGFWLRYRSIKVIGNVTDNPEMLKEDKDVSMLAKEDS